MHERTLLIGVGTSIGRDELSVHERMITVPSSSYVRGLRSRIGNEFLLLPAVTAVIEDGDRFLLVRQRDTEQWSFVGGAVEPDETPLDAVRREVFEELGVVPTVGGIIGAYGGTQLNATYANGDRVGYVTVAYRCSLPRERFVLQLDEIVEAQWLSRDGIAELDRFSWVDEIIRDLPAA